MYQLKLSLLIHKHIAHLQIQQFKGKQVVHWVRYISQC